MFIEVFNALVNEFLCFYDDFQLVNGTSVESDGFEMINCFLVGTAKRFQLIH